MIGVCIRYRKHDATLAALSVVQNLESSGRRCSIYHYDWRARSVDPAYDHRVKDLNHLTQREFDKWLSKLKHIIWTSIPERQMLTYTKRKGIENVLYTAWDQLAPEDEPVVKLFSQVVTPSPRQAAQIRYQFKLRTISMAPYNCGYPITRRREDISDGSIRIFLSLYGLQLRRIDLSVILLLANLVEENDKVHLVIACTRGLAPYTIKELKRFSKRFGERWVIQHSEWHSQCLELGQYDLIVWPPKCDGFGIIGQSSLYMGTPLISWDAPPMNEYLANDVNSVLVKSVTEDDWLGGSRIIPDYDAFEQKLKRLCADPTKLRTLKKYTHELLDERMREGNRIWNTILPAS